MTTLARLALAAGLAAATPSFAQYAFFTAEQGDWFADANWDTLAYPDGTTAIINNGGTVLLQGGLATPVHIAIGHDAIETGIGATAGDGALIQTGGTLSMSPFTQIWAGYRGGTHGLLEVAGPGRIEAPAPSNIANIGRGGFGTLHLHGGAFATFGQLAVGGRRALITEGYDAHGDLIVEGPGTHLVLTRTNEGDGALALGTKGSVIATIADGARVTTPNALLLASTASDAHLNVLGADTLIEYGDGASTFFHMGSDDRAPAPVGRAILTLGGATIDGVSLGGTTEFQVGPGGTLRGNGRIRTAAFRATLGSRIEPGGPGIGELTLEAPCRFTAHPWYSPPLATLAVDVDTTNSTTAHDCITVTAVQGLYDATLEVTLTGSDTLSIGDAFEIITITDQAGVWGDDAVDVLGNFQSFDTPDLGPDRVLRTLVSTDRVELIVACPADIDLDGGVTPEDLDAFIAAFVYADYPNGRADLNADGQTNLDDIQRFVDAYLTACGG